MAALVAMAYKTKGFIDLRTKFGVKFGELVTGVTQLFGYSQPELIIHGWNDIDRYKLILVGKSMVGFNKEIPFLTPIKYDQDLINRFLDLILNKEYYLDPSNFVYDERFGVTKTLNERVIFHHNDFIIPEKVTYRILSIGLLIFCGMISERDGLEIIQRMLQKYKGRVKVTLVAKQYIIVEVIDGNFKIVDSRTTVSVNVQPRLPPI